MLKDALMMAHDLLTPAKLRMPDYELIQLEKNQFYAKTTTKNGRKKQRMTGNWKERAMISSNLL